MSTEGDCALLEGDGELGLREQDWQAKPARDSDRPLIMRTEAGGALDRERGKSLPQHPTHGPGQDLRSP